jgi:asparagine synthase (glutamine-hydrolysing)
LCGIAGAWGAMSPGAVEAMTAALAHRGPDDSGFHARQELRLGVRRLSIVDVPGGAQPVYSENGEVCAVINGEIYNHRELRAQLEAMGHRFSSHCDVEVIVHLYEEFGDRCVDHLRGMFAFAIADGERLLLARDRLGIKPLYYSVVPGGVLFASEIKAMLRCPELRPALDVQAFADSRAIGYPVGDRTFIEGVRAVLPGHTMAVARGPAGPVLEARQYYSIPAEHNESLTFDAAQDQLIEMLRGVVRSHLAADVEVGLILSGGLDSTTLAMLARDAGRSLRTFSVASGPNHPDMVQAARVADALGWPHNATAPSFDDYVSAIPAYTHAQEVPGTLGGLSLLLLYRRVGAQLKACLNGEGADELFGGYEEYISRRHRGWTLEARLRNFRGLSSIGITPSPRALDIIYAVSREQPLPVYVDRLLAENMRDQLVRMHLEVLDKCAMAAGVEMRVPFMDHRLVEFVMSLPTRYKVNLPFGIQKHVLKRAALRAWGSDGPIVDSVLRRKIGAPTAASDYRAKLAEMCERELPDDYLTRHEFGSCFSAKLDLLLHELFCEIFLAGRAADPADVSMHDFIAERAGKALPVSS